MYGGTVRGLLMHCQNPHHSRYFHLSEELKRAKWREARAEKRNAGAFAEMVARNENVEGDGI